MCRSLQRPHATAFGAKPLADPLNLAFTLREGLGARMDRVPAQNQRMPMPDR
jgi:hypothetical protein